MSDQRSVRIIVDVTAHPRAVAAVLDAQPSFHTLAELQVRYPASDSTLPLGLSGRSFVAVFGAQQSPLEALLIKRRLKGPSWVHLKGATRVEYAHQVREGGMGI